MNDVCLLHYPGNLRNDYRLVRVCQTYPDKKNLVRTVKVAYRKKDKRENPMEYKKKPLVEERVAVQRLSVLLSSDEQSLDGITA